MKKFLFTALAVLMTAAVSSQSLEILYNGQTVDGTVEIEVTEVENFQTFFFDIANISTRFIDVLVKKENLNVLDGSENMFCFGNSCFDSEAPEETFHIAASDTFSYDNNGTDAFHTTYYAGGKFGKSYVKYTFSNNMMPEDSVSMIVIYNSEAAGIGQADENAGITVYPNPTTGKFTVALPETIDGNSTVSLFDVTGKLLFPSSATLIEKSKDFDITNYPTGLYFINIQDKNKNYNIKIQKN